MMEKPNAAKNIASAPGHIQGRGYFEGGWLIFWRIGHLVGLAGAAACDDRYKKRRFLPDPFRILRSLMECPDVTELVNACDAGR